ncbi:MAG: hypothetical protein AB7O97_13245 [Planctomycetota bacterium]
MTYPSPFAAGLFTLLTVSAPAQDLAEARALRDRSVPLWEQQDYGGASAALQQAHAIYIRLEGDHAPDIAVVCRAIVWNEAMRRDAAAAQQWFEELLALAADRPELDGELRSAYGGLWRLSADTDGTAAKVAVLERARAALQQHPGSATARRLAAQCLHDIGNAHGDAGDLPAMRSMLGRAVAERAAIGDETGRCWSLVSTAYHELRAGLADEAATPLRQAWVLAETAPVLECQGALAINYGDLVRIGRETGPSPGVVDALWAIAESAVGSDRPFALPPDRAVRSAFELDRAARGDAKAALAAGKRALQLEERLDAPAEVHADLRLRVAAALADGGTAGTRYARSLAEGLDCGDGPCAPHLQARRDGLLAVLAAHGKQSADYARLARDAVAAMRALGDRQGLLDLLQQLTSIRPAKGTAEAHAELQRQLDELRSQGGPGGDGSSAQSQGVGTLPADVGPHTVVFELRFEPPTDGEGLGTAVLTDRIGGGSKRLDLRWKPRNVSFNGCGLGLFGGYVTVRSLQYGGAASAGGAPGQCSLDELGSYLPLCQGGRWLLHHNGAVRFAREQ